MLLFPAQLRGRLLRNKAEKLPPSCHLFPPVKHPAYGTGLPSSTVLTSLFAGVGRDTLDLMQSKPGGMVLGSDWDCSRV